MPFYKKTSRKIKYFFLALFIANTSLAASNDHADYCLSIGGHVVHSSAYLNTNAGDTQGISHDFCLIQDASKASMAMIGLQTLASDKPSIAATYLLKGIKIDKAYSKEYSNPAIGICKNLGGTSISFYTSGGMSNEFGLDHVCIFGDGSMVSTWAIWYISSKPSYLNLRKVIHSQPLPMELPLLN